MWVGLGFSGFFLVGALYAVYRCLCTRGIVRGLGRVLFLCFWLFCVVGVLRLLVI